MSVSEIQKVRSKLSAWGRKHKDNPAITTRVHIVSKSLVQLAEEPDRPGLRSQVQANIADLEATLALPSPQ